MSGSTKHFRDDISQAAYAVMEPARNQREHLRTELLLNGVWTPQWSPLGISGSTRNFAEARG